MSTPLGHPDTWENSLAGLADRFGQRNRTRDDDIIEVELVLRGGVRLIGVMMPPPADAPEDVQAICCRVSTNTVDDGWDEEATFFRAGDVITAKTIFSPAEEEGA